MVEGPSLRTLVAFLPEPVLKSRRGEGGALDLTHHGLYQRFERAVVQTVSFWFMLAVVCRVVWQSTYSRPCPRSSLSLASRRVLCGPNPVSPGQSEFWAVGKCQA